MKEKTADIDILEELKEWFNNFDLDSIKHKPEEYIQAISTLIAKNKELKEFKENIEKIDRKQLDKLYKDAQKALKEYRETQNKVAKLEEENKELKEKNKRYEEIYKNYGIDDLVQELEKYRVENKELKEDNKCLKNKELDYMTVYLTGTYDERNKWKSKVEEKIDELEKIKQKDEVDEFGIHSRDWWVADIIQEQFKELLNERNNTDV